MRPRRLARPLQVLWLVMLITLHACGGSDSASTSSTQPAVIALQSAYPNLSPLGPIVALKQTPGDNSQWYAAIQDGHVLRFANDASVSTAQTFLDISDRVAYGGEMGLLGLAFHPDYATNGEVYVYYTADTPRRSIISRFTYVMNAWQEAILLTVAQPYTNHNGGNIVFGPDGYLYIGLGDGGSGGDPNGYAQNTRVLLGSMLRIDVDAATPYAIPAGNPFYGNALCNDPNTVVNAANCPEIYAWGLRNPWRWSFDRSNGTLWLADVGQSLVEEVDIIENGKNYGWNVMEGAQCYNASSCTRTGLTTPVAVYGHADSHSIVGGYVYRGQDARLQQVLQNTYLYADTYSTRIWGLIPTAAGYQATELINSNLQYIYSFAEDNQGELYVLDPAIGSTTPGSNIYKIVAN